MVGQTWWDKPGGTNQVADIFDQQQLKVFPIVELIGHHPRVQVTGPAGGDLPDRVAVFQQPLRVVIGLDVACQNGRPRPARHGIATQPGHWCSRHFVR
jgi:hypothetical protein